MGTTQPARVISVGGARGAGKSVLAANLAVALAQDGARVVLVDAGGGAACQRGLLRGGGFGPGLEAFLAGALPELGPAVLETGVGGLRLLSGGAAVAGPSGPAASRPARLLSHLRALDADLVVVDAGAGAGEEVLSRLEAADLRLVVATPEPEAVRGAYAVLTGLALRELRRGAAAAGGLARLDAAVDEVGVLRGTAPLLARLAREDAALVAALQARVASLGARLVGNQLAAARESDVVFALSRLAHDFLGLEAPVLGSLRAHPGLLASAAEGRPWLLRAGIDGDDATAALRTMARSLRALPRPAVAGRAGGDEPLPPPATTAALPAALPVDVGEYLRAYERHLVDLDVTLVLPGGVRPALLKDVSEGGGLCELDDPPPVGARVTLVVPGLGEHPGVACVVRHASLARRRAGLQFQVLPEEGRAIADGIRGLGLDRLLD